MGRGVAAARHTGGKYLRSRGIEVPDTFAQLCRACREMPGLDAIDPFEFVLDVLVGHHQSAPAARHTPHRVDQGAQTGVGAQGRSRDPAECRQKEPVTAPEFALAPAHPDRRLPSWRIRRLAEVYVSDAAARSWRRPAMSTTRRAASEIKRLMKAVRDNEMPVDDTHLYRDIDPDTRAALLDYGGAFEATVDAARAWEEEHVKPR